MIKPIPKWEQKKYAVLWSKFARKPFTNNEAREVLKEKNEHNISVFFYNLKKSGWIDIERNEEDKRKKIYKLNEPNAIIEKMAEYC